MANTITLYIDNDTNDNSYVTQKLIHLNCCFGTLITSWFFNEQVKGKTIPETVTLCEAGEDGKEVPVAEREIYHLLTSGEAISFLKAYLEAKKAEGIEETRKDEPARQSSFNLKKSTIGLAKGMISLLKQTGRNVVVCAP